ncbi:MAG: DUF393 domain-containing protein [Polyangiaceae bacterium]
MSDPFEIEVFYDGACPLCTREINWLRRLDRAHHIRFTDIAQAEFDATSVGLSFSALMERIHGRLPDGTWIEGVEVFRRLYAAVGFKTLVGATRLPGIAQLLELSYQAFAKNRLKFTGRCADHACAVHPEQARALKP